MRDFYKVLRLTPHAKSGKMRYAIKHCKQQDIAVLAEEILLHEKKKRVYKAAHKTLHTLADLGNRLRLSHTKEYTDLISPEFILPDSSINKKDTALPQEKFVIQPIKEGDCSSREIASYKIFNLVMITIIILCVSFSIVAFIIDWKKSSKNEEGNILQPTFKIEAE